MSLLIDVVGSLDWGDLMIEGAVTAVGQNHLELFLFVCWVVVSLLGRQLGLAAIASPHGLSM